jgi:tyrosinase
VVFSLVSFRFWDWAERRVEEEGLPEVLYEDPIEIKVPGGKTITVSNPLAYMLILKTPNDFVNTTDQAVSV